MNFRRFPSLKRCFDVLITALSTLLILWALQLHKQSITDKLDEQKKHYLTREQFTQLLDDELAKRHLITNPGVHEPNE